MTSAELLRTVLAAVLGLVAAAGNLLGGYFVVRKEWPRQYLQYFLALGSGYMGVQPIGALMAGGLAKRFGAPMTLAIFGSVCLLGSLLFAAWVMLRVRPAEQAATSAVGGK